MSIIAKIAALCLLACFTACDPTWYRAQVGIEATAIAGMACDGGTTSDFLTHTQIPERNAILGNHPSELALWGYLGGIGAALVVVDHLWLDRQWPVWGPRIASVLAGSVAATEWWSVVHNMGVGSSFCGVGKGGPWEMPVIETRSGT